MKFSFFCGMANVAISGASAQAVYDRIGLTSWYGAHEAGHRAASGAVFDLTKLGAAPRISCTAFSPTQTIL
jgi:rare lipoprotein A (peptidoglycan hydrolase)